MYVDHRVSSLHSGYLTVEACNDDDDDDDDDCRGTASFIIKRSEVASHRS